MTDVFAIADILVSHALAAHQGQIALIAYYGSYAKGLASPTSDLDIFYIPDDGQAEALSSQFVLDGLPYDFWPISWDFAENIANARSGRPWAVSASLIADARVLYHRSPADLARFTALQARIAELTQPSSRSLMVAKGLEAFKDTLSLLAQVQLAAAAGDQVGMTWAGQRFVASAVNCLALVNQTYFAKGWGANLGQALTLVQRPADLATLITAVVLPSDAASLLAGAQGLAAEVRSILLAAQAELATPENAGRVFKDFYPGIFEYVGKVQAACDRGDAIAAAYAAGQIQEELCAMLNQVQASWTPTPANLLGDYLAAYRQAGFPDLLDPAARGDLVELARRAQQFDDAARAWLHRQAVDLNILDSAHDLRRFLQQRDPVETH